MKIVDRDFVPGGPGSVKVLPEEEYDLWIAYNLIAKGDTILASTTRKVGWEKASGRDRSRDFEPVKLKLEIQVQTMEYDKEVPSLRIRGKNIVENEHIKIGAFHTLQIELHQDFVLKKEVWDSLALNALHEAFDLSANADLGVVLIQEGLAYIFLVGKSVTISRSRIETSIPRTRNKQYERPAIAIKAMNKFFDNVLEEFVKHIDFKLVRCAVIASSGSTKDQFHRHLLMEAERKQLRNIIENKSRIVLVHTNTYNKQRSLTLREVLDAPNVINMMDAKKVQALKEFLSMSESSDPRACYGPNEVEVAHGRMAVQTLLITDELLRNYNAETRQRYANLVKSVEDSKGNVYIFSSIHVLGQQLAQHTGIAAILRFPLQDLADNDMEVIEEQRETS